MAYSYLFPTITPAYYSYIQKSDVDLNDAAVIKEIEECERLIKVCIALAEYYCNQPLLRASCQKFIRPVGEEMLLPFTVPVSVTALHYREDAFSDWVLVDSDNYAATSEGRLTRLAYRNMTSNQHRLTAQVGYSENAMDANLMQIIIEMVYDLYKGTNDGRFGLLSKAVSGAGTTATITYKDMNPVFLKRLNTYRVTTV